MIHRRAIVLEPRQYAALLLQSRKLRQCNLCNGGFRAINRFERFCPQCREASEELRFADWLPELDEMITERISA